MSSLIVNHGGYKCEVMFDSYAYNANTALILIGVESDYKGEVIAVATANGSMVLPPNIVGIKDWSENEGIVESLIDANVIKPEMSDYEPSGFVEIKYYELTEEAIKLKNSQSSGN